MGFRFNIAALREDWIDLFRTVGGDELLCFYPTVAFSPGEIVPQRIQSISTLGNTKYGILVQEDSYLAIPAVKQIKPREIRQNNGVTRYAIDQLVNSDSFIFNPGGPWNNRCYIIGEISSLYNTGVSVSIAKKLKVVAKKTFHSQDDYWIGPRCHLLYSDYKFTADCRY